MSVKPVLCLVLLCLALPAAAKDVDMFPLGDGHVERPAEPADPAQVMEVVDPLGKRADDTTPANGKPPARRANEVEAGTRPPRWHSFLPGMIR